MTEYDDGFRAGIEQGRQLQKAEWPHRTEDHHMEISPNEEEVCSCGLDWPCEVRLLRSQLAEVQALASARSEALAAATAGNARLMAALVPRSEGETIMDAAERIVRQLAEAKAAGDEYIQLTDPLVFCGEELICGECRGCLQSKLAEKEAEVERLQRSKYGTPCKRELWMEASRKAEERAEQAEAALGRALQKAEELSADCEDCRMGRHEPYGHRQFHKGYRQGASDVAEALRAELSPAPSHDAKKEESRCQR